MPRLAWLTDIHLNFVDAAAIAALESDIRFRQVDGVLISGDIAEAPSFASYLKDLQLRVGVPVYFVLGNHDFYHGSIASAREAARELTRSGIGLHYLPEAGVVPLSETTALVGHDAWGDARIGDFLNSTIRLNDYRLIAELCTRFPDLPHGPSSRRSELSPQELQQKLQALGDEAAAHLNHALTEALAKHRHAFVLIHVPPFRESCVYDGAVTDDNWAPHFTCDAVGKMLLEIAAAHPDRKITVLCGHTHGGVGYKPRNNLHIITGAAEYRAPIIQDVLEIP